MNTIIEVDDFKFSLNGVKYLKNYLSRPYGNKLEVYNCYERKDVLIEQAHYSEFTVDGATFGSVAALQEALLNVLYNRNSLNEGTFPDATTTTKGKVQLAGDLGGTAAAPTVPGLSLRLLIETPAATGAALVFTYDRVYGTVAAPITGNITANTAGAKLGVTHLIIHKHATTPPTFSSPFKKLNGSQDYIVNAINYIYVQYVDSTHILYSIQQA